MSRGTHDEEARAVFGRRAGYYATSAAHTEVAVLDRVVSLAACRPDWLAADVGTGAGHTAFAMAPHVARVVAIDPTPEMLREATGLATTKGIGNVDLCLGTAEALPLATGSTDLVTCRRAAHHFHDIGASLAEMHRVLRSGGTLVVDDRSVPEDDFVDETMQRLDWHHDHSHVAQYRPSVWRAMLERQGFDVSAVETYTRHRPLTSLTDNVAPDDLAAIRSLLDGLSDDLRSCLGLTDVNGEPYCTHWFVLLAANRP